MEFWQNIYFNFNPVAFDLGGIKVHWYGIMYAVALLVAIFMAHYIVKKDNIGIETDVLDNYIWWAEIGVILGARLGYIIFYDPHTSYYLTHPWQIFNPFMDGTFVGISGMSYHGALAGFIISTFIFCKKYKVSFWLIADIAAIAVPLGYIFGRIGNFVNQELVGRATDVPWGIIVHGGLRHPSQLYEAFLEGFVVFVVIFMYRKYKKFDGELALIYVMLYSLMRIFAENYRQPDIQLGFLLGTSWLTMGISISLGFIILGFMLYIYKFKANK
ncbi:MAG: prolipoprotein diacylglyceryl transferase [Arcobacter sp.]|nr:prolipoprotein diacylglyceryl transferase [Arcobacter sp.]